MILAAVKKVTNNYTFIPHCKAQKLIITYTLVSSQVFSEHTAAPPPPAHIQPAGKMAATFFLRDTTMLTGRNNGT